MDEGDEEAGQPVAGEKKDRLRGPYLEPEDVGGPYTPLSVKGTYRANIDNENSREEFQSTMAREVPSVAGAEITNPKRRELLEQYILAVHQYRQHWRRFPELEEYFTMVENREWVPVEDELTE